MIIDELFEGPQLCPECGGISFSDLILAEKKDACYHKVKASAKVWPSAYASGRLVQCRKKGAANYGNKSEGVAEANLSELNKDTVYSYAVKADKDQGKQSDITGKAYLDNDPKTANKAHHKFSMRAAGLDRAEKRLNKEGVAEGSRTPQDWEVKSAVWRNNKQGKLAPHDVKSHNVRADRSSRAEKKASKDYEPGRGTWEIHPRGNKGVAETRRGQIPMTLQPGETDNIEPENISGFRTLPAYKQGQAAQQKAGKQLIQKSPFTFQSDQDWAYRQGAFDTQQAAMFANFGGTKPLTTAEGEQQKGADYRDPKEVNYDDEYDAMVARVKRLAGLGPMKTVYDPKRRVYRNMPTAQQPKK
jgi:hypothetical protein